MQRLNTEKSLAPYVTQFVPLKVDTATPEYAELQRKHRSEGNTIPKIFVIRADGKKLYAKSGSLSGDQLPTLMVAAVREMGRPLSPTEAKTLAEINQEIKAAIDKKDWRTAGQLFRKIKKLGPFGGITSFAKAAVENNQLASQMQTSIEEFATEFASSIESAETRFEAGIQLMQLKSDIGTLPSFRKGINELEKSLRSKLENSKKLSELKSVAAAIRKLDHASETARTRAVTTLQDFVESTEDATAKEFISGLMKQVETPLPQKSPPKERIWTSNDGKFSIKATYLKSDGVNVSLKKSNGETIAVPLSRLSKTDHQYVKTMGR